jgi:hypothetical protein
MRKSIVFTVLVLFCTSEALAWGVTGHRLVASIAFRQLSVAERDATVVILKKHPRYNQDFDDRMPANVAAAGPGTQNEWLFQQAALWPDMARDFHGALAQPGIRSQRNLASSRGCRMAHIAPVYSAQ